MRLIAKAISILCAKFHCNRLTTVQDKQYYASLIFTARHVCIARICRGKISVCLSVTRRYCVQTVKDILNFFHHR